MRAKFIRRRFTIRQTFLRIALCVAAALAAAAIVVSAFPGLPEESVNIYPNSVLMLCFGLVILASCAEKLIL